MKLPPLDIKPLARLGASPVGIDLGVKIPSRCPRRITADEANRMFGVSKAVKMNFVPQMLVALALDYDDQFVGHCRRNRIAEFKKHNRVIKTCIEKHNDNLAKSYGKNYMLYTEYVGRYFEYVKADRFKMWCSIGNVVYKQIPESRDQQGAILIAVIHKLISYAEAYDRKMDNEISDAMNAPVSRKRDGMLLIIIAMCCEFEETWGFEIKPDPIIDLNIEVLANRAACLVDMIIAEEKAGRYSNK